MSLEKGIEHKKEHRKQYYDSRRFDKTCRCHGGCPWCESRRTYNGRRVEQNAESDIKEYHSED